MRVVVCLPTRNEEQSIQRMIDEIKALGYNLFISDAASTDNTAKIALNNNIKVYQRKKGIGKGYGIQDAISIAHKLGYEYLVITDCDMSYPCGDIPKLLEYVPEYDLVIGTRNLKNVSASHKLGNLIHVLAINVLFNSRLKDINSGMRALKISKFVNLLNAKGFDIEAQITTRAIKNGFRIKEVPISYKDRVGKSKIKLRDGFLILNRIIKERFIK